MDDVSTEVKVLEVENATLRRGLAHILVANHDWKDDRVFCSYCNLLKKIALTEIESSLQNGASRL